MLRAHYRETPNSKQVDQRREKDKMEEGKKKERRSERGGSSLPRAPRNKDIPKIENFPKTPEFLNNTRGTVI